MFGAQQLQQQQASVSIMNTTVVQTLHIAQSLSINSKTTHTFHDHGSMCLCLEHARSICPPACLPARISLIMFAAYFHARMLMRNKNENTSLHSHKLSGTP